MTIGQEQDLIYASESISGPILGALGQVFEEIWPPQVKHLRSCQQNLRNRQEYSGQSPKFKVCALHLIVTVCVL